MLISWTDAAYVSADVHHCGKNTRRTAGGGGYTRAARPISTAAMARWVYSAARM